MKEPKGAVTMRDIAESLGLSVITVSRCLRGEQGHRSETRARVQAEARRLGYRSNPLVQAFVTQRRQGNRWGDVTLGLINPHNYNSMNQPMFRGVLDRAEMSGFKVDTFSFPGEGISGKRMRQILNTRRIWGLIIGPFPKEDGRLGLDMEGIAAVSLSASVRDPALPMVRNDYFRRAWSALEQLAKRGYRRPLFALDRDSLKRGDFKLGGAIHSHQAYITDFEHFDELILDGIPKRKQLKELLLKRLRKGGHDVVLSPMNPVYTIMQEDGMIKPGRLGFLHLHRQPNHTCSGYDQNLYRVGMEAVDLLSSLMMNNRFGLIEDPVSYVVPSQWKEGDSL